MTSHKRKADATESSSGSPHKRARSESSENKMGKHNRDAHVSAEPPDEHVEPLNTTVDPANGSQTAPDSENEAAPLGELPQSWDQADTADKLLVTIKESNPKAMWAKVEQKWERSTGIKPPKGTLSDRFRQLRDIRAHSGAGDPVSRKGRSKVVQKSVETSNGMSTPLTTRARPSNPAIGGSPDTSSRAISTRSKTTVESSNNASVAPASDVASEEDLLQSWEQASAGDQLIVRMKSGRKGWERVEEAWQELTGEKPAEGALKDRYDRIKTFVILPETNGANTSKSRRKASTVGGASDPTTSQPAMPSLEISRKRKAEPEVSEKPLAESLDESSLDFPKPSNKAEDTLETADEMLVEMRERGCDWVEISKAWTDRTGLTHAPDSLRKRYGRIKKRSATKLSTTTQTSGNRKIKATSPNPDLYGLSSKRRRKSTAETPNDTKIPVKRNMDRGKRKNSTKYTESTTDEDELYAAPVEPVTTAPPKRNAGRATKVNRSDPEWLVTNEKSPLAEEDLHADFCNPKTYENFTKSDWDEIRETLPSSVPINPDGYSIPMTFFKYDPDFRRGIREFQEDLGSGRLDPKWQAAAAEAMEERAQGRFDSYKENQFEAFWGQKQKLNHDALAGESAKIKLDVLIQNQTFKVGDCFSYSRMFGRGKNGVLVEKDCKIVEVNETSLTFAVPPGERKYSRQSFELGTSGDANPGGIATIPVDDEQPPKDVDSKSGAARNFTDTETNGHEAAEASEKGDGALIGEETYENGNPPDSSRTQETGITSEEKADKTDAAEAMNAELPEAQATNKPPGDEIRGVTALNGANKNGASSPKDGSHSSPSATSAEQEEDTLLSISMLTQLEKKILDLDGRINSNDMTVSNTWKNFRGVRNNQDLGTLFEMREEFYVYKHPQIVKEAKKRR